MTEKEKQNVPLLKKWAVAFRPWALPASTMPVIFGTSLAVVIGGVRLDILGFILALLGMMILHSAANVLSDVFDFKRGLDTQVTPVSGAIVRKWISPAQAAAAAAVLFFIGSAAGLFLVLRTGIILLAIGTAGVFIGLFYAALKTHALGDLAVFLDFGILGGLGAWVVQTRSFSWLPALWTVPMAMLVSGILHANNWRDILTDSEKKVRTVASLLGDRGSLAYYAFLIFGPFLIVSGFILIPRLGGGGQAMPLTFLLSLLALPNALSLWGRARRRQSPRRPMDFVILDGATSRHNLVFGLLCTAAVWVHYLLRP